MSTLVALVLLLCCIVTFGLGRTLQVFAVVAVVVLAVGFLKVALSVMFLYLLVLALKPAITKRKRR